MIGTNYEDELPGYGNLFSVSEFINDCRKGYLTDDDGSGHPVKDDKMSELTITPSSLGNIPDDATHILWFNN